MEKKNNGIQTAMMIVLAILIVLCIAALLFLKTKSKIPALMQTNARSSEETHAGANAEASDSGENAFFSQIEGFEITKKDGNAGAEAAREEDDDEYLCSFSSERLLTEADIRNLRAGVYDDLPEGKDIIQMVVNEMYARYGYQFNNQEILAYFEQKQWYNDIMGKTSDMDYIYQNMSEIEKENVSFLSDMRGE